MKTTFLSLLFVCITCTGICQRIPDKDYTLNAGADLAYAAGRFNYAHRLGFGISVEGGYNFADNSSVTVNTGYIFFPSKTFAASDSINPSIPTDQLKSFGMVPLLFGLKLDNDGKFYVHPQFGFAFRSKPFVSATYALGIGMVTSPRSDFSFRFAAVQKKGIVASFFAVRAAYIF